MIESIIVTDVALMRDGLAHALDRHVSMRVVGAAATPDEAVSVVAQKQPAVVLLDMSTASWPEIMSELRRTWVRPPIVLFSVGDNHDDLLACVEMGGAWFVPKHETIDDLVTACQNAVRGEAHCSPAIAAEIFRRMAARAPLTEGARPESLLSSREMEIVELIERGFSNKAIARHLSIGLATVKNHVHNILQKLHVTTRGEAAAVLRKTPSARVAPFQSPILGRAAARRN